MADYNSSLPIRTEAAGDVDIFISDSVTPSQKLVIEADGSINVNNEDLAFATDSVDVSGSSVTVTATDLDIRDLTHVSDSLKIGDGTEFMAVNVDGSINAVVTATDLDTRDLLFATDKVDVSGSTVAATQSGTWDIGTVTTLTGITNDVNIADGGNSITVDAVDLDVRNLNAAQDSIQANLFDEAGVAYSGANPLPVSIASDQEGDEIVDFNTSAAVVKDASVNHDYSVTALKTFLGEEAWISGSGKLKVEMLVNGLTVFVGFNSTANPNVRIPLEKILKANAGEVIRFTITNRDNQAQDVYSTLSGLEL